MFVITNSLHLSYFIVISLSLKCGYSDFCFIPPCFLSLIHAFAAFTLIFLPVTVVVFAVVFIFSTVILSFIIRLCYLFISFFCSLLLFAPAALSCYSTYLFPTSLMFLLCLSASIDGCIAQYYAHLTISIRYYRYYTSISMPYIYFVGV